MRCCTLTRIRCSFEASFPALPLVSSDRFQSSRGFFLGTYSTFRIEFHRLYLRFFGNTNTGRKWHASILSLDFLLFLPRTSHMAWPPLIAHQVAQSSPMGRHQHHQSNKNWARSSRPFNWNAFALTTAADLTRSHTSPCPLLVCFPAIAVCAGTNQASQPQILQPGDSIRGPTFTSYINCFDCGRAGSEAIHEFWEDTI